MSEVSSIVVIGAGQAGVAAVETLRAQGYTGHLTLIGEEEFLPYQRPPLSKKYLLGETTIKSLTLRPKSYFEENDVTVHTNSRVESIEPDRRVITIEDGSQIAWDRLLLATGSVPRSLPPELSNGFDSIFTIRTIRDVDQVAKRFDGHSRLLIVGGGYIGLEAAAVARQRQLSATVIEAAPRILQRVAAEETSQFVADLHRRNEVDLREGVSIETIQARADRDCTIRLSDNSEIDVDFIIAGIGVDPAIELAQEAGLEIENGIAVDQFCRTSNPAIFAAGDCACFPWRGQRMRLESVQNAIEQARTAASNILDQPKPYNPVPWFWSDQYDVKLQIAGLNHGYNHTIVRDGARQGSKSVWYFKDQELLAVDAMNDAPSFMCAKNLLAAGQSPDISAIQNPSTNLRELCKEALQA